VPSGSLAVPDILTPLVGNTIAWSGPALTMGNEFVPTGGFEPEGEAESAGVGSGWAKSVEPSSEDEELSLE